MAFTCPVWAMWRNTLPNSSALGPPGCDIVHRRRIQRVDDIGVKMHIDGSIGKVVCEQAHWIS